MFGIRFVLTIFQAEEFCGVIYFVKSSKSQKSIFKLRGPRRGLTFGSLSCFMSRQIPRS